MSDVNVSLRAAGPPGVHWLSPDLLVAQAGLAEGMTVAVFESDPGFYAVPVARSLSPAVRLLPTTTRGSSCHAAIPESSCDCLILADLWHDNAANPGLFADLKRTLKPGGRLVLFDWNHAGPCPPGPPLSTRVSLHDAICAAERASLTVLHARAHDGGYLLLLEPTDETVQS